MSDEQVTGPTCENGQVQQLIAAAIDAAVADGKLSGLEAFRTKARILLNRRFAEKFSGELLEGIAKSEGVSAHGIDWGAIDWAKVIALIIELIAKFKK